MNATDRNKDLEDMAASLGLFPTSLSSPSIPTNSTGLRPSKHTSFLQRNYPIFTTPYLRVYWQGVLPIDGLILDPLPTASLLPYAKLVRIDYKGANSPALTTIINNLLADRAWVNKLYVDKEFHKQLVAELAITGALLDKDKVANRAAFEQVLSTYLNDMESFLVSSGYSTAAGFLSSRGGNSGSKVIDFTDKDAFNSFFDSL